MNFVFCDLWFFRCKILVQRVIQSYCCVLLVDFIKLSTHFESKYPYFVWTNSPTAGCWTKRTEFYQSWVYNQWSGLASSSSSPDKCAKLALRKWTLLHFSDAVMCIYLILGHGGSVHSVQALHLLIYKQNKYTNIQQRKYTNKTANLPLWQSHVVVNPLPPAYRIEAHLEKQKKTKIKIYFQV